MNIEKEIRKRELELALLKQAYSLMKGEGVTKEQVHDSIKQADLVEQADLAEQADLGDQIKMVDLEEYPKGHERVEKIPKKHKYPKGHKEFRKLGDELLRAKKLDPSTQEGTSNKKAVSVALRKGKHWSKHEDDLLLEFVRKGYNTREIAGLMKRIPTSVMRRRNQLNVGRSQLKRGIKHTPRTPRGTRGIKHTRKGIKHKVVAGQEDRRRGVIPVASKPKREYPSGHKYPFGKGKSKYRVRWSRADEKIAIGMKKNGYRASQIADRVGRTTGAVYVKLHELRGNGKL